jgi:hypothetical protein
MAMTIQQAQMKAMQLRAQRPELQNMAVGDLVAQIMASEGMGQPGAGAGGLANLFPTQLSPASPAPMQPAQLEARKPTAEIVPGAGVDAFRRAQEVRGFAAQQPSVAESSAANARVDDLVAGLRAPEVAAEVPVAAPEAVAEAAPEAAPKPQFQSRYRPMLEQAEADLQKLDAQQQAIAAQGGVAPPALVSQFENLSGKVSQLKSMVAAEEGAVVNAERAAVLERQTQRLGREEELIKQSRRLAPGTALMEFGGALAGAKPGESFASALARGLQAGSKSYTGARDAREASLRGIEERRDALILQNADAIEKARADAIALSRTGVELDAQQLALTKLKRDDVKSLATQKADIDLANANASKATTEAAYAPRILDADLALTRARTVDALRPPASSGSGSGTGEKPLSAAQATLRLNALRKQVSDSFKAGDAYANSKNFAEAERKFNETGAAIAAYNKLAASAGLPSIGKPGTSKAFNAYVAKNGMPSGRGGSGKIVSSKPI